VSSVFGVDGSSWWFLEKHIKGEFAEPSSCNFCILICLTIGLACYLVFFDLKPCSQSVDTIPQIKVTSLTKKETVLHVVVAGAAHEFWTASRKPPSTQLYPPLL
jgi:hypothetical protein